MYIIDVLRIFYFLVLVTGNLSQISVGQTGDLHPGEEWQDMRSGRPGFHNEQAAFAETYMNYIPSLQRKGNG